MYKGRFFVRARIFRMGSHTEAQVYPVFQPPGERRSRCKPTRECQKIINQRDAERKAQRLILTNFGEDGLEIDLTFSKPHSEAEAQAAIRKYVRRLREEYRRNGWELKYLYTMEKGVRSGRVHFHMVMNPGPLSRDELEKLWPHGYANSRRLVLDETGLAGISRYITKQGKARKPEEAGRRRWSCSRNLVRPQPEIKDGAVTVADVEDLADAIDREQAEDVIRRQFPGMELVEATLTRNQVNRGQYIELRMAAPAMWRGRPPRASYLTIEAEGGFCVQ